MPPSKVSLPCLLGDEECQFTTVELEFSQAKELVDGHMKYAHGAGGGYSSGGGDNHRKPEKFPRPEIKLDSTAEDWAEFEVTWQQYKELDSNQSGTVTDGSDEDDQPRSAADFEACARVTGLRSPPMSSL